MDFKNKTKFFFLKLVKDRILLMTLYLIPYWDFYWFVFQIEMMWFRTQMQPISLYEDAAAKTLNRLKYNDYILGLFLSNKVISDIDAFVQAKCLVYFGIFIVESMHYKPAID